MCVDIGNGNGPGEPAAVRILQRQSDEKASVKRMDSGWSALRRAFRALLALAVLGFAPGAMADPVGDVPAAAEMGCCGGGDASSCAMGPGACAEICQGAIPISTEFAPPYAGPADSIGIASRPDLGKTTEAAPVLAFGPAPGGGPPAYLLFRRLLL